MFGLRRERRVSRCSATQHGSQLAGGARARRQQHRLHRVRAGPSRPTRPTGTARQARTALFKQNSITLTLIKIFNFMKRLTYRRKPWDPSVNMKL